MYHIGIVENIVSPKTKGVVSADDSVQALIKMWDNNLLILPVHRKISGSIKKGDYVLNDYTPMSPTSRYRNLFVIKILSEKEGKQIWQKFQEELERRKKLVQQMHNAQNMQNPSATVPQLRYIR
ncbi:hypothetical protein JXA56_04320 [Candidatus Micrarchaeota archaeon]|nr:hypothetical protein [Candidatus Micrarchaeota archaeon]